MVIIFVVAVVFLFVGLAMWIVRGSGKRIRQMEKEDPDVFKSGAEDDDIAGSPFD